MIAILALCGTTTTSSSGSIIAYVYVVGHLQQLFTFILCTRAELSHDHNRSYNNLRKLHKKVVNIDNVQTGFMHSAVNE